MPRAYREFEIGTTVQFTWTGSTAPASLSLAVLTSSATLVNCGPAVQSQGGAWFRFAAIPDSFGNYPALLLAEWTATASTHASSQSLFVNRMLFRVKKTQVI